MIDYSEMYGGNDEEPEVKPLLEKPEETTKFEVKGAMVELKLSSINGTKAVMIPTSSYVQMLLDRVAKLERDGRANSVRVSRLEAANKQLLNMIQALKVRLDNKMDKF